LSQAFFFRGVVPASKSVLNRLRVIQSFEPGLRIEGDSPADDVAGMKSALAELLRGKPAECGAAGTTFRFLALRASRLPGESRLRGTERLFSRPQGELLSLLRQLGCGAELGARELVVRGQGWRIPPVLRIDRSVSSQFASAVALSAWELPEPLRIHFEGETVSPGYFELTLRLLERAGMRWRWESPAELVIPAGNKAKPVSIAAETDASSAFAVAAHAAIGGEAVFEGWPLEGLQPDFRFVAILGQMGCQATFLNGALRIAAPEAELRPVEQDLRDAPDLFPVLAVLCALAPGTSLLHGAPHLKSKESDRIAKMAELLRLMGRRCREVRGGLEIEGRPQGDRMPEGHVRYDTDQDHRLALAAALAKRAGLDVEILSPEVVAKSFPGFWDAVQVSP
jgi:3-phosphoshikimate 1-carboxyvinyltransferase